MNVLEYLELVKADQEKLSNPELRELFSNINLTDLAYLSADDLIQNAPSPLARLYIRVLIPKFLEQFVGTNVNDTDDDERALVRALSISNRIACTPSNLIPYSASPDGTILDFQSVLRSSVPDMVSKLWTLRELIGNITEIQNRQAVEYIDMSNCGLIDADIPELLEFISHFPNELTLSIKQNKFTSIRPLLSAKLKWIDVTGNVHPLLHTIDNCITTPLILLDHAGLSEYEIYQHLKYYHTVFVHTDMLDLMRRRIAKPRIRRITSEDEERILLSHKRSFSNCRNYDQRQALACKIGNELRYTPGEVYTGMFSN